MWWDFGAGSNSVRWQFLYSQSNNFWCRNFSNVVTDNIDDNDKFSDAIAVGERVADGIDHVIFVIHVAVTLLISGLRNHRRVGFLALM